MLEYLASYIIRKLSIYMSYQHLELIIHSDPDIFELIFKDNTRSAVDEYIQVLLEHAEHLRSVGEMTAPIPIIIDVTQSGIYSLPYSRVKIAELTTQVQDMPRAYFAYLISHEQDRFIIENFNYTGNTREKDTRQVFTGAQRGKAVAWLLSHMED